MVGNQGSGGRRHGVGGETETMTRGKDVERVGRRDGKEGDS